MSISVGSDEIENRFGFHKASIEGDNATLPKHTDLRLTFREMAEYLDEVLPVGRTKSLAFIELENASMWSHKALAEAQPLVKEEYNDIEATIRRVLENTDVDSIVTNKHVDRLTSELVDAIKENN